MDRNGDSIAENTGGIASFSCILPKTTKHFLAQIPGRDLAPGRLRHHQRPLAGDRPPAGHHRGLADLPSRRAGRLRGLHRASPGCRRQPVVGRLPGGLRGGRPHPADAADPRGRAQRGAAGALPEQRPRARPGARRPGGAGHRQRGLRRAGSPNSSRIPKLADLQALGRALQRRADRAMRQAIAAAARRQLVRDASRPMASTSTSPPSPAPSTVTGDTMLHRLRRHLPADRPRHQLRHELHPRLCGLSGEMRARPLHPAQRGQLPRHRRSGRRRAASSTRASPPRSAPASSPATCWPARSTRR